MKTGPRLRDDMSIHTKRAIIFVKKATGYRRARSRGVHGQGGGKSTSDGYDSRCSYFRRWISGSVG